MTSRSGARLPHRGEQALREDRDFTRTEPGRGCRFTAAVKSTAPWNSSWRAARPWRRPGRGTVSRWISIRFFPECSQQSASGSTVAKSRLCKALALAVALGLSTFSYTVQAATAGGSGTVESLYDTLLSTMKNGRTLVHSLLCSCYFSRNNSACTSKLPYAAHVAKTLAGRHPYENLLAAARHFRGGRFEWLPAFTFTLFEEAARCRLPVGWK